MSDNSLTPPKSIRARSSQRSIIRELLKLASQPDVISFAGGLPAPELFPVEELKQVSLQVLEESGQKALQYSTTEGYEPLRRQIAQRHRLHFHRNLAGQARFDLFRFVRQIGRAHV